MKLGVRLRNRGAKLDAGQAIMMPMRLVTIALTVAAAMMLAGGAWAQTQVVTERGETVTLTEKIWGYFEVARQGKDRAAGRDSHGNRVTQVRGSKFRIIETDIAPLIDGNRFGVRWRMPAIAFGDSIKFEVRVTLPKEVKVSGSMTRTISGKIRHGAGKSNSRQFFTWGYGPSLAQYNIEGTWRFQVLNKGRVIFDQEFTVAKP